MVPTRFALEGSTLAWYISQAASPGTGSQPDTSLRAGDRATRRYGTANQRARRRSGRWIRTSEADPSMQISSAPMRLHTFIPTPAFLLPPVLASLFIRGALGTPISPGLHCAE